MQEEVNEKTVSLCITGGKVTARLLKQAMMRFLAAMEKEKAEKARKQQVKGPPDKDYHGKQSLKKLAQQNVQLSNIEIIEIPDFMKVTSSESGGLTKDTVGYEIEGKDGTWEVIDYLLVEGKNYFLMEHEQYGKDVAYVVLDQKGNVLVDSTYNGFDDVVKQKILDSLHPPVQEQTEGYKPKLDNWQKYMENGEYLRSAEITEEANYNMIDGLKNNAAPKDKKNHQKESVLAKLNEKKEEIARRTGQKAMQQVMESEGERTKK